MGQEFTIKSQAIEDKVNQLLPSQGGFGAGVDFSASTMVVPIVDLTETAEGSNIRQDIQRAISFRSINSFSVSGGSSDTDIITTTGYYQVQFLISVLNGGTLTFKLGDGTSTKNIWQLTAPAVATSSPLIDSLVIFINAGDKFILNSTSTDTRVSGNYRQIADISGNLVNPT
tara:strand:+ start:78 stop:593 length:516 start_codon:yes stop_codon:yes gene_type:complete